MNLIAAADRNWAIGRQGRLLVTIPQDQKQFQEKTLGKVIVMGRKTLESLPGGRPLYGRQNIVLSRDPSYRVKGARVCHSVEEVLALVKDVPSEQVYIIGGESLYRQFLPCCDRAYVTAIDFAYAADVHMPDLDADGEWRMAEESDEQTYFDLCYTYRIYERVENKD